MIFCRRKTKLLTFLVAVRLVFISASAPAITSSVYTTVNSKDNAELCVYTEAAPEKGHFSGCEFDCRGPLDSVRTKLHSCSDYDHLYLAVDGKMLSTWRAMTEVGAFSGFGNRQGLMEWVFAGNEKKRDNLIGAIVRFEGIVNANGGMRSQLAVFGLKNSEMCWKGNVTHNAEARKRVEQGECLEQLVDTTEETQAFKGFDGIACGSDIIGTLRGRHMAPGRVSLIEKKYQSLRLRNLGAYMLDSEGYTISWSICDEKYVLLVLDQTAVDLIKLPAIPENELPVAVTCSRSGKPLPNVMPILLGGATAENAGVVRAWQINLETKQFDELQPDGLICPNPHN